MIAAPGLGEFLSGMVAGVFVGLLLGPAVRFWLRWHEWAEASREARLTEDVLERMERGPVGFLEGRTAAGTSHPRNRPTT